MAYSEFLITLLEDGRVTVPEFSPLADDDIAAGDAVIADYERLYRLEMPGPAPRLIGTAGRWAGTHFFRACQFLVYRDISEEVLTKELSVPYREPATPGVHYSVDLIFRFLPDLVRRAAAAAEHDPLVACLDRWASRWPLSAVGLAGADVAKIREFEENDCLMRLYADRVIATNDKTSLSHAGVREHVRAALGMFPELAEGLRGALAEYEQAAEQDNQDQAT